MAVGRSATLSPVTSQMRQKPYSAYCQPCSKTIPRRRSPGARRPDSIHWPFPELTSAGDMRKILLSTIKVLVSAALLYLALRKVSFSELASRINVASLVWIGLAIAALFLQIFAGALRWREISADCGAP